MQCEQTKFIAESDFGVSHIFESVAHLESTSNSTDGVGIAALPTIDVLNSDFEEYL